MVNLITLFSKLLPVLKGKVPLWFVLLWLIPMLISTFTLRNNLNNTRNELEQRKAEVNTLEVKLNSLSAHADRIEQQAKENEAICSKRIADRETIKQIMKTPAVKSTVFKPKVIASSVDNVSSEDSVLLLHEIISKEVSVEAVRFINAHLD